MDRRGFLTGLSAVICAPAIVRATSLMPINARLAAAPLAYRGTPLYFDLMTITRRAIVPDLYAQIYTEGEGWTKVSFREMPFGR